MPLMLYITKNLCSRHFSTSAAGQLPPLSLLLFTGWRLRSFIIVRCFCSLWGKLCSHSVSSLLVKNTVVQFFMVWLIPTSRYTAFMMMRAKLYPLLVEWHSFAFNNNGFMKLCSQFFRFPKRKLSYLREPLREFILLDLQVSRSKGTS